MLYCIHHSDQNEPLLLGESSKDIVAVRFNTTLDDMKQLATVILQKRQELFRIHTGALFITEAGKRIVHKLEERTSS